MSRIAFIGLGNMGLPMATNMVRAGHNVAGFDLSEEAKAAAQKMGMTTPGTVAEAVAEAEIVVSMLPAGKHVLSVYTGEDGVLANVPAGAMLIDSSTIDVPSARAVAEAAKDAGFEMVDAPVSGGVAAAMAGTLTFMVGGSETAFERAKVVLDSMGQNIFHAGDNCTGQAAKICNNMVLGISMIGVCEAFALGEKLGLDPQKFFDISATASGQCWSLTSYCPEPGPVPTSPANNDYKPGFAAAMMLKDLRLAQEAASQVGQSTPLGSEAEAIYALFDNLGHGSTDFSGIINMLKGKL